MFDKLEAVERRYEELTKIQEYGGLVKTKFPADLNYTMYGYSGYFVLGNDCHLV